jgi:hypothetical protein
VDLVATRLMGFEWKKIESLRWLLEHSPQPMGIASIRSIQIHSNHAPWATLLSETVVDDLAFQPHPGWRGHIEVDRC